MGKYLPKTLLREQQKPLQMMRNMLKDYTTMLVSSGLCLVLLYYLMVEPPVAFLLAAFLISWRIVEKGLQITTQRMLFSVALAGALVAAGIVYEAWEVKHLTVLRAPE